MNMHGSITARSHLLIVPQLLLDLSQNFPHYLGNSPLYSAERGVTV